MSIEFIKTKQGSRYLSVARRQAKQISYLVESDIQEEVNLKYIEQWADRNYLGNDYFLNWIKAIFKTENFLSFYKYFRYPIASASVVNNKVVPALERVFHADDSFFRYSIEGETVNDIEELQTEAFNEVIFDALLFRHNDILFYDFPEINKPARMLIGINQIVAINADRENIKQIAFKGSFNDEPAIIYADSKEYIVYDYDYNILNQNAHDLGECPADFISKEPFKSREDNITRRSIFSYSIEKLEEYIFLKTLQRMTEANGAIPIVTEIKAGRSKKEGQEKNAQEGEPMASGIMSGGQQEYGSEVQGKNNDSPLQAGTRIKIPPIRKADGSYDMDAIKHFINFFYTPVEALKYLDERIEAVEKNLLIDLIGDYSEDNPAAMNELQVSKGFKSKQDKLRRFSKALSWIRNKSDKKMIKLMSGTKEVDVDCFYGSDFFLESQADLYDLFLKSPNSIERKNILLRLTRNRNKNNAGKAERESLMYKLLPFASDKDFDKAVAGFRVGEMTYQLQVRFDYYVGIFESRYGDIVYFYNLIEGDESIRLVTITNLLIDIIKEYYEKPEPEASTAPEGVQ